VAAALALAKVLECTVEELFGLSATVARTDTAAEWAWKPEGSNPFAISQSAQASWFVADEALRYWCANVQGRVLVYPVEATPLGVIPHDGLGRPEHVSFLLSSGKTVAGEAARRLAEKTLVIAGCDPAAGLMARVYEQATGFRMLVIPRSSRRALSLLEQGLVHVAGVHLSAANEQGGNAMSVKQTMSRPVRLLHVTEWDAGIAIGSGTSANTVRGLLREKLTWIGREPGSGARQCLDELLQNRPTPKRMASDHRGVAEAIRCGWADAGICLRLVAQEAGLRFLPVRNEGYDFCFARSAEDDPRIQALIRVIQSPELRRLIAELPGYDSRRSGELATVD
jgi:molybdate-binding protein